MRINVAVPEAHVSPEVLNAALEATTKLNESMIKEGDVPTFDQALPALQWKPEPPGDEHFDHAGVVLGRGWGDCDDLAPYHAASLRATGRDRGARAVVKRSGPKRWHAVVRRSNGKIDDPSAAAGMHDYTGPAGVFGVGGVVGISGCGLPTMFPAVSGVNGSYLARPQLALRPVQSYGGQAEAWQARADLPWHWAPGKSPADVAMVSLHASPISSQSIVGAVRGLARLGAANGVPDDALDRLDAIADCCEGWSWEDLADEYGEEHATAAGQVVGSFFGSVFKGIKKAVSAPFKVIEQVPGIGPVVRTARKVVHQVAPSVLPFVPGVGPIAAAALKMASPQLKGLLQSGRHLPPGIPSGAAAPGFSAAPYGGGPRGQNLHCIPFG